MDTFVTAHDPRDENRIRERDALFEESVRTGKSYTRKTISKAEWRERCERNERRLTEHLDRYGCS